MSRTVPPNPPAAGSAPATVSIGPAPLATPNSAQPSVMIPQWTPPANVLTHWRKPIAPDAVFFAAPPAEIGEVITAHTTVRAAKPPKSAGLRAAIALIAALPGLGIIVLAAINATPDARGIAIFLATTFALLCALVAWLATAFRARCSYVGRLGAIRLQYRGDKKNPKAESIRFDQAAELRTQTTRHYTNGLYTGTSYSYTWTDAAGKRVRTFSGRHRGKNAPPKPGDPFHFVHQTELAWSDYLLDRAADELARTGALAFKISAGKAVRVGPGFIEFQWSGQPQRFEAAEIGRFDLNQGVFRIHHKDARWFSAAGKYSFKYGDMPNARLFLLALDRFIRITK